MLGTGVKGEIKEPLKDIINKINSLTNQVVSIDLPSGIKAEFGNNRQQIIKADTTLTLQYPKLAMLLPEAGEYCGNIKILKIGISDVFLANTETQFHYITEELIKDITPRRDKFAHKGIYGHALLICGSKGMVGAATLATGSALRSGCGLVTLHLPYEERHAVQTNFPSAMLSFDNEEYFSELPSDLSKYSAIGIGCGLGHSEETIEAFKQLLSIARMPMVLDADALNIISEDHKLVQYIPEGSILTPHLGELKRLIGEWKDEKDKIEHASRLAANLKSVIIVKGAHTMVCLHYGNSYFNSTGNSGMAKGGSGDVLTGYITGLLARGCTNTQAALIGVYNHGKAGDKAAFQHGMEQMNSQDLINLL